MKIRKLNPGDSRGCIAEAGELQFSRWDLKTTYTISMREKGSENVGDVASRFEIMPIDTELIDWSDKEYLDWIAIHDSHRDKKGNHTYCKECGAVGNIVRNKDGSYFKLNDGTINMY